jgi:flagellar basal-body rod modification protein FlgD
MSLAPITAIGSRSSAMPLGVGSSFSNASTSGTSTTAATGTTGTATTGVTPAPTQSKTELDREAFLKLLVAQLQNQDPSKPVDASQMISQSAQLTVVDKLEQIQQSLDTSSANNRLALAGSVMGKMVTFQGSNGQMVTERVTGVTFDIDGLLLRAGEWSVPLDAVRQITEPTPATTVTPVAPATPPATTPAPTTDPAPTTTPAPAA